MSSFINVSQRRELQTWELNADAGGRYAHFSYNQPSQWLLVWGRLFQTIVSQAGTYLLTRKFHDQEVGIFKSEGGCHIHEVGDITLDAPGISFDGVSSGSPFVDGKEAQCLAELARLITHLVLKFDPMQPIESLLEHAANFITTVHDGDLEYNKQVKQGLLEATTKGRYVIFAPNPLDAFFDRTRRGRQKEEIDLDLRPYKRYVLTTFAGKTDVDVDQLFADADLGYQLEHKLRERLAPLHKYVFACAPSRHEEGLRFWLNSSIGFGWCTEEKIRELIAKPDAELARMNQDSLAGKEKK